MLQQERHCPLRLAPWVAEFEQCAGAAGIEFAQCQLGGRSQKYTRLSATPGWTPPSGPSLLSGFANLPLCPCSVRDPKRTSGYGYHEHASRVVGRNADGSYVSTDLAAYPDAMNRLLAEGAARVHIFAKELRDVGIARGR